MTPLFSSTFWTLTISDISCCMRNLLKLIFMGSPLWFTLVYKIAEFWRWKLWDQNFDPLDSGNIHIKESKRPGFTFSIELRINSKIFRVISWSIQSASKSSMLETFIQLATKWSQKKCKKFQCCWSLQTFYTKKHWFNKHAKFMLTEKRKKYWNDCNRNIENKFEKKENFSIRWLKILATIGLNQELN